MICYDNGTYTIKLADFGISKQLNTGTTIVTRYVPGTIAWIAPEVLADVKHVGIFEKFIIFKYKRDCSIKY